VEVSAGPQACGRCCVVRATDVANDSSLTGYDGERCESSVTVSQITDILLRIDNESISLLRNPFCERCFRLLGWQSVPKRPCISARWVQHGSQQNERNTKPKRGVAEKQVNYYILKRDLVNTPLIGMQKR
jgi:hypothetical protein